MTIIPSVFICLAVMPALFVQVEVRAEAKQLQRTAASPQSTPKTKFKEQVMRPAAEAPGASAPAPVTASPGGPEVNPDGSLRYPGAVQQQQWADPSKLHEQYQNQRGNEPNEMLLRLMSQMASSLGNPSGFHGDPIPKDGIYPDDHRFASGKKGAGNIGNGLCTQDNAKRTQVTSGLCAKLMDLLTKPGTCANQYLTTLISAAIENPNQPEGLREWCPSFAQMTNTTERAAVFQQILAALIVQESGWDIKAAEDPWTHPTTGKRMGGKGLFQIDERDADKDPDCAGLNGTNVFEAEANMKCGACIALKFMAKDMHLGRGNASSNAVGMARYFGPMGDKQKDKRDAMGKAVANYCIERKSPVTASSSNGSDSDSTSTRRGK